MKIRIKQKWGLTFLILVMTVYFFIYFFEYSIPKDELVEIYFADRITAAHKILIDKYNKINEGKTKVIPIDFPNFDFSTNERKELLARSLRGRGDGIDLFAVDLIWVQRFAKWCEPLDQYFNEDEINRILDRALESCYYNQSLVAMPLDLVQGIMYYREDIIKEKDNSGNLLNILENNITWEEFIDLNSELNYSESFYIFPAADYEGLICSFVELILSIKPNYFEENGFNLRKKEAEKSLQLLVDMVNKHEMTPKIVTEFSEIPSYKYFIENDALFIRGWNSYDKDFANRPFDQIKESHLRKAPIPYFEGGEPTSVLGGWNLMVSKFSTKKKEAVDFIKFLLEDESQKLFYTEAGYYPVIKQFYEDEELKKEYPAIEGYKNLLNTGVHRPAHVEYTRYSEIMSHYFELAIKKEITVKEALENASKTIEEERILLKKLND